MSQTQPQELVAGANAPLPNDNISIRILSHNAIDCAAYRLTSSGKVRGDGDMIFYGQTRSDDGSVSFRGHDSDGFFDINLPAQANEIEKIALAFSSNQTLSQLGDVDIQVLQGSQVLITCQLSSAGRDEKAIILAECYRRQGNWKFRFIAQGFNGGLKPLSEHFGVEIADEAPEQNQSQSQAINTQKPNRSTQSNGNQNTAQSNPPPIPASPSVNLSKITLTKNQSSINLTKRDDFGKIAVNLNWNQRPNADKAAPKKGLLGDLFKQRGSGGIDLDIGAMVHLKNGEKTLIQALGNRFGNLNGSPFVLLRADDRTGQVSDGEWLDINGQQWSQIQEVFIFAFIYEGVPNWAQTDGVVTIHVPGQPPIETRLTEGAGNAPMCAIARLVNQQGSINVERINQYFNGHKEMDKAFNWGFSWKRGSK
ncbi:MULTISPECIES: TerD family protein [Psychrobacter]|mgnify:CR=1 FL=1|jgi:tellurite resistance protein TerA|uniref:TerD family protein n=1 Tax=Psychrobacter TaxID=497 RepID=UPI000EE1768A|nr:MULTISPECIES: TerD family protein [Psychrobacter]MCG3880832.1 TerD family protein [Psychrobacter sp. Ps3]HAM60278.1 tellurium resistance protein TerA [Psychrobacter sp.]|tara:strand:- start:3466 stop:4734 length:1269 start_codon:yes stop_codon:yes gene_type:complete